VVGDYKGIFWEELDGLGGFCLVYY